MKSIAEKIYSISPHFLQNCYVVLYDMQYLKRRGGNYGKCKEYYKKIYTASLEELQVVQRKRLAEYLNYVNSRSSYYRRIWQGIDIGTISSPEGLKVLPVVEKEDIRANINEVVTVAPGDSWVSHTGGTTGKSLTTYYRWDDARERMAILDAFRERFGWRLGRKTAWFSGKNLLSNRDEGKKRFWKTDFLFNIRYYSTFHISEDNVPYYIQDLERYQPEYINCFPSNIIAIAEYLKRKNIRLHFKPKAIFTTSEALVPEQVELMEQQFGSVVRDQYASSEGAPFIVGCECGRMHFLPTTGVIEVVDEKGCPADEGEMLITSFTTKGTPLVRYRIGDGIRMSKEKKTPCGCGSFAPVVEKIEGRINDFLYSKERGKITLGNVSNCVKYSNGVVKFQAMQDNVDEVVVKLVIDKALYTTKDEAAIVNEFAARLGPKIRIRTEYVDDISKEKSGKYRIVKNTISPQ
jgi:phenylacetate-CoA ligase